MCSALNISQRQTVVDSLVGFPYMLPSFVDRLETQLHCIRSKKIPLRSFPLTHRVVAGKECVVGRKDRVISTEKRLARQEFSPICLKALSCATATVSSSGVHGPILNEPVYVLEAAVAFSLPFWM